MRHGIRWQWMGAVVMMGGLLAGRAVAQTSSTVKDDLFAGTEKFANGASDVTEVDMDPDTLKMVGGHDAQRAHGMVLNVVKTYEYPKPGMYNVADVEAIRARLNTGEWHCTVHTRELKSGESTDICYKHRTDGLVEQAIITVEPRELTFIHQIRHEGGGDGSHLSLPEMGGLAGPEMAGISGEMEATMAALGPVMEAKMAAMGPALEARMAAMGPEIEARMAAMEPQIEASVEAAQRANPELQSLQEQLNQSRPELDAEQLRSLKQLQDQIRKQTESLQDQIRKQSEKAH